MPPTAKRARVEGGTTAPWTDPPPPPPPQDGRGFLASAFISFPALVEAYEAGDLLLGNLPIGEAQSLLPDADAVAAALAAAHSGGEGPHFFVDAHPLVATLERMPPQLRVHWSTGAGAEGETRPATWPPASAASSTPGFGPPSLHLDPTRLRLPGLTRIQSLVDAGWGGEGSCAASLVLGPSASPSLALPPHSRVEDVLLFVCDGKMELEVLSGPLGEEEEEGHASWLLPDLSPSPIRLFDRAEFVDEGGEALRFSRPRGGAAFLPAGAVWSLSNLSPSAVTLLLSLPPQPDAHATLRTLIDSVIEQDAREGAGSRRFPHSAAHAGAPPLTVLDTSLQSLLQRAAAERAAAQALLLRRCAALSAMHFDCAQWLRGHHGTLDSLLERSSNGLAVVPDFLPPPVAQRVREALLCGRQECWARAAGGSPSFYAGGEGVEHSFSSTTSFPHSAAILALMATLQPSQRALYSAGLYEFRGEEGEADHIDRHDDAARRRFPLFECEEGEGGEEDASRPFERSVAVILYLTACEWKEKYGGLFLDLAGEEAEAVLPTFNTLVAFRVPRWHAVSPVTPSAPPRSRLSIFGWHYV